MEIITGFRAHDPSGVITTRTAPPDPNRANPYPAYVETRWSEHEGVDRETTIFTDRDAIRIHTHEIPALIEKLQGHLISIEQRGGIPR